MEYPALCVVFRKQFESAPAPAATEYENVPSEVDGVAHVAQDQLGFGQLFAQLVGVHFVDALAPLKVKVRHRNSMVQPSTTLEIGRRAKVTGVHHGGHGNRYAK